MSYVNDVRNVVVDGCETPFDIVLSQMDDELREQLQANESVKTDQDFVDAYLRAHERKFGEPFTVLH